MKIAVYGIDDFSFGKKIIPDERVDKLKDLYRPQKAAYAQVEFLDASRLKDSQAIVCWDNRKDELILMDLEYVEARLNVSTDEADRQALAFCQEQLNKESFLNELNFSDEQKRILSTYQFVTIKPLLLVSSEEAKDSAAIARKIFYASGMIVFFTGGPKEVHAWAIKKGSSAPQAAGAIHSDFERGFIKAEVISYEDLVSSGGENQAKAKGLMKLHDKDYIVKDGDVMMFRFNV